MAANPADFMAASAATGLVSSIGAAYAQQAQGYYRAAGLAVQAQENLRLAGLRADKEIEYGEASFKRNLMKIEYDTLNYKIQANSLMKNLQRANATALARGYASGAVATEGSIAGIRAMNVREAYKDVRISDLNAMTARIMGLEDATTLLQSSYDSAFYNREAAIQNTKTALKSGGYATDTSGLLAGVELMKGVSSFAQTFPFKAYMD